MGDNLGWIIYALSVLVVSGVIGMHLGRFREAYTEMTGMMAGMMMGMLNGFLLGYCAAAATNNMFWGNLFGIILGLSLGAYFGRAGGLMGIMDGAMGGVMGGSMGAMLAVMVVFPREGLFWTAVLLGGLYVAGMVGLMVMIEQSAPEHAALHRLMPMFTRAVAVEAAEEAESGSARHATARAANSTRERRLVDYYAMLDVYPDAIEDEIEAAYLEKLESADEATAARLERALAVLTDPQKRRVYDLKLAENKAAPAQVYNRATINRTVRVAPQDVSQTSNGPISARPAGTGKSGYGVDTNNGAHGAANNSNGGAQSQARGQAQQTAVQARPAQSPKQGKAANGSKGSRGSGQRQTSQAVRKQQVRYVRTTQPAQQSTVISVSWVGGLAVLVIVVALGWWVLGGRGGASARVPAPNSQAAIQLEAQAVTAPIGADGKQTLDLVINGSTISYEPSVIKVKQGVPVHFNISIKGPDPG